MQFDLPLEKLREYRYPVAEPSDFDEFWHRTLTEAARFPVNPVFTPYDAELSTVDVLDVTFAGYGGDPIKAWLLLPRERIGALARDRGIPRLRQRTGTADRVTGLRLRRLRPFRHGHPWTGQQLAGRRHR